MKKQTNQSKEDLKFPDFALMPAPAKREKQLWLPVTTDFSKIQVDMLLIILLRLSHPAPVFSRFLSFHNKVGPLFSDLQFFLHDKHKARNINISNLRRISEILRNPHSLANEMYFVLTKLTVLAHPNRGYYKFYSI